MMYIYYTKIQNNIMNKISMDIFPETIKKYLMKKQNLRTFLTSVFSWYCLDKIVKKHYHLNLCDLDFYFNQNGKPFVQNFKFNISHSHDMCVIAISNKNLGIDIEKIRKINHLEEKIHKLCVDLPQEHDNALRYFFTCFTQYEAFIKYKGKSLGNPKKKLHIRNDVCTEVIKDNDEVYIVSYKGTKKVQIRKLSIE